jgi:type I restriction enzyme S subunit
MERHEPQPLGSRASVIAGQSPEGKYYNGSGQGLPFYQGKKDFGDRELRPPTVWTSRTTKEAQAGDILMSVRAPVGPINYAREAVCIGRGLAAIRCHEGLDSDFLFYQLLGMQADIAGKEGAVFASINKAEIEALSIVVPPPAEQRRIVAILDEAFEGIATAKANAERNLQNAREWAARQLTTVLARESAAGESTLLESLVASGCSLSYGIVQPGDDVEGGLPVVRPVDLGAKYVGKEGLKRIDPVLARGYARTTLEGGDLLLCVRGTTGTVAVAEMALAGANVTRGIVPIRFDPKLICQGLGYYLLRSEPFQAQIRAKTYGTALMQINIGDLRKIVLRVPLLERQAEVVEQLDAVQAAASRLADVYERKVSAIGELKQSLLDQAFSGGLNNDYADRQISKIE